MTIRGDRQKIAWLGAASALVVPAVATVLYQKRKQRLKTIVPPRRKTKETPPPLPDGAYDVIIVGAGPAGATLAYYLAKSSPKMRILLLERKKFPRVKYCGDAWCAPALDILEQMEWSPGVSVLDELHQKGLCRPVQRGGLVSPFGHVCANIGDNAPIYGSATSLKTVRTYAIKRVIVDEYIALAAEKAGAELRQETEADISNIKFNGSSWTVPIKNGGASYTGRILVAADGATSYLARHMGLVQTDPDSTCSHRYVKGGTHAFPLDGVMYFNKSILPGYTALFRHYNDDMYLGTYILAGGKATSRCLPGFEEELVQRHPLVREAFKGKSCADSEWRVDLDAGENGRQKTAPIRCGGEKKSFGDHFLVVGDAAGQTDPMTGEGIHTAMIASVLAAETIQEMFEKQNFSAEATQVYQEKWMQNFGYDFKWSSTIMHLISNFPILLDAACAYGQSKGQTFLDEFGQIMTGVKHKASLLNPSMAVPISFYLAREIFLQYILRRTPLVPQDIGKALIDDHASKKRAANGTVNGK